MSLIRKGVGVANFFNSLTIIHLVSVRYLRITTRGLGEKNHCIGWGWMIDLVAKYNV
jgi:hypothetical protein